MSQVPLSGNATAYSVIPIPGEETIQLHTNNSQLTDLSLIKNVAGSPNTGRYSSSSKTANLYVSPDEYTSLLSKFPIGTPVAFTLVYESTLSRKNVVRFDCPNMTIHFQFGAGATAATGVNATSDS